MYLDKLASIHCPICEGSGMHDRLFYEMKFHHSPPPHTVSVSSKCHSVSPPPPHTVSVSSKCHSVSPIFAVKMRYNPFTSITQLSLTYKKKDDHNPGSMPYDWPVLLHQIPSQAMDAGFSISSWLILFQYKTLK